MTTPLVLPSTSPQGWMSMAPPIPAEQDEKPPHTPPHSRLTTPGAPPICWTPSGYVLQVCEFRTVPGDNGLEGEQQDGTQTALGIRTPPRRHSALWP